MPFDLSPEYTVETEPSLEGLLRWLETQDPKERYNFYNIRDCLLCRYGKSLGRPGFNSAGGDDIAFDDGTRIYICDRSVAAERPWTYGAAAERCRALLRER